MQLAGGRSLLVGAANGLLLLTGFRFATTLFTSGFAGGRLESWPTVLGGGRLPLACCLLCGFGRGTLFSGGRHEQFRCKTVTLDCRSICEVIENTKNGIGIFSLFVDAQAWSVLKVSMARVAPFSSRKDCKMSVAATWSTTRRCCWRACPAS